MPFFEPPPREDNPWDRPRPPQPPWSAPPRGVIPGSAPLELVIARTGSAAVAVSGAGVYPTGLSFSLVVRVRSLSAQVRPLHELVMGVRRRGPSNARELLRFGVAFSDGRVATNLYGSRGPAGPDFEQAPSISLAATGASGGDLSYEASWWLWPLPPPGALAFVCEWPLMGIPESRREVDVTPLLEAAVRAIELWPGDLTAEGDTTGSTTSTLVLQSEGEPPVAPGSG